MNKVIAKPPTKSDADKLTDFVTSVRIRMIKDLASTGGVDMADYGDMKSEDFYAAIKQVLPEYKGKIGGK